MIYKIIKQYSFVKRTEVFVRNLIIPIFELSLDYFSKR